MRNLFFALVLLFSAACHKRAAQDKEAVPSEAGEFSNVKVEQNKLKNNQEDDKPPRVLRAAVYFASSIEREALRLILKNDELQKTMLFNVLSYSLESKAGVKKTVPRGLDCSKIESVKVGNTWVVKKTCRQPHQEIAYIRELEQKKQYEISFVIEHWASVMGMSAVITGSNITCKLRASDDEKLSGLSCNNWSYQVSEGKLSSTVVRADQFEFDREAQHQLVIKGGFYQELVKNKNIDITVPLHGKIKIIEKELKVIDEFSAYKDGVTNEGKIEESKNSEEKNVKNGEVKPTDESKVEEKNDPKAGEESGEKGEKNQEGNQGNETGPVSQDESSAETGGQQQPEAPRRGR